VTPMDRATATTAGGYGSGPAELLGLLKKLREFLDRKPDALNGAVGSQPELQALLAELQSRLGTRASGDGAAARMDFAALLAHYRELFEFAPDGYLVTDNIGVIKEANMAAALLLHTRKDFLVGRPLLFFLPELERTQFVSLLYALVRGGQPSRAWETVLRSHRGPTIEVSITVTPIRGPAGEIAELRWLLREESERKRAEQALRSERGFADQLIDLAPFIVLVLDRSGHIVRGNRYLQSLSGYSNRELLGDDGWRRLQPAGEQDWLQPAIDRLLEDGAGDWGSHRLLTRAGRERTVNWSAKPIYRVREEGLRILAIGVDVTELQAAQEHALQTERLAAIGQVSVGLAHEGRNALQRGQACLDRLLWRLKGQPELEDLLTRLQKAQNDLVVLFEEVREYSAPLQLERQPCRLEEVCQEAWENARAAHPNRDAHLDLGSADQGLDCHADRRRLRQVFRNIFENSLDACSDPVQVTIIARESLWNSRPAVRAVVRDNGPGLNPEQQRNIFEPFYTTKSRGTGLGMAIVRRIVEAHGGHVGVGEGPGPGAEIILILPRREP
jgi:two-component system, LuxR family, sensor kinase FixL